MQELRRLLSGPEAARLDVIEELLFNQELHAKEVAKVLAEAVRLRNKTDDALSQALSLTIESAIKTSVAKNPRPLSDALFPVMGPAIRKSISNTIATMMQSLNQTLEHAFSLQGLKWRFDSIRTGKSFAEIVMLNTLVYRVEQIFLIHKKTGILLRHLAYDKKLSEDADLVSGMLTAVQDFIRDSFDSGAGQEIENLRMGDLEIVIEQSPDVVLAVICRGSVPQSLHSTSQVVVEEVQQQFSEELRTFDGDSKPFEQVDEQLNVLMVSHYRQTDEKKSPVKAIAGVLLLSAFLLIWSGWSYYQHLQWLGYIDRLNSTPGIVITQIQEKSGQHVIFGMRDPLAVDPVSLLPAYGIDPEDVSMHWQAYHSLDTSFILGRVATRINPPESVNIGLKGSTLVLSGKALPDWIDRAKSEALLISGIDAVDSRQLSVIDLHGILLKKIRERLNPPPTVTLQLLNSRLILSGEATEAWAARARTSVKQIAELTGYDDRKLVITDSPDYLLRLAYRKLMPPDSVKLSVTGKRELIASGEATTRWIMSAHEKAKNIPGITAYNDSGIKRSDDYSRVLAMAVERLHPPEGVELTYRDGTLFAAGVAPSTWIKEARATAPAIRGVAVFDDSRLQNSTVMWARLKEEIDHIRIRFRPNRADLLPGEVKKIHDIFDKYRRAVALQPDSTVLQLTGVSGTVGWRQLILAKVRADRVREMLTELGLDEQKLRSTASEKADGKSRFWGVSVSLLKEQAPQS